MCAVTQPLHDAGNPEDYAGAPVDDGWDLVDGVGDDAGWPQIVARGLPVEGVNDGRVDSGSLPADPQV